MKPRNMPGRVHARRVRADERARANLPGLTIDGVPGLVNVYPTRGARANAHPAIADQCIRLGRSKRNAQGLPL